MVKKAAEKAVTKKATKKVAVKNATNKATTSKVAAKKTTKKTSKKASAKKATSSVRKTLPLEPTHAQIESKALDIYQQRVSSGNDGSAESDWFAAIDSLRSTS